jgi:hypothetical protein
MFKEKWERFLAILLFFVYCTCCFFLGIKKRKEREKKDVGKV